MGKPSFIDNQFVENNQAKQFTRQELELVINKHKIGSVFEWFNQYFIASKLIEYYQKCPIVFIQGPPGCGKTSTIRWVASELGLQIKEYNDSVIDNTALNYDIQGLNRMAIDGGKSISIVAAKRQADMFEVFLSQSIRFRDITEIRSQSSRPNGLIILVETPLQFLLIQKMFTHFICRLISIIKGLARRVDRRVAIVFESIDTGKDKIILSTKDKEKMRINIFKFNPITNTNMNKFIDHVFKQFYPTSIVDKSIKNLIVNDSNGDLKACINTISMLSPISNADIDMPDVKLEFFKRQKKLKTHHPNNQTHCLNVLRGTSRNFDFFHILGKIFYQKRLYPSTNFSQPNANNVTNNHEYYNSNSLDGCKEKNSNCDLRKYQFNQRIYPTENKTEDLAAMIGISVSYLMAWLHQHYLRFCPPEDVSQAALFCENFSEVDIMSLDSTQSSQFYELHHLCEEIQTITAIQSTVFSLYYDQSSNHKKSEKPIRMDNGEMKIIKSSVFINNRESCNARAQEQSDNNFNIFGFKKPDSTNQVRLIDSYKRLVEIVGTKFMSIDSKKFRLDYIPYLSCFLETRDVDFFEFLSNPKLSSDESLRNANEDRSLDKLLSAAVFAIDRFDFVDKIDFEMKYENLTCLIDKLDSDIPFNEILLSGSSSHN